MRCRPGCRGLYNLNMEADRLAKKYALVTPARNEAAYLPKAIDSVFRQTVLPVRWVIVSDGSTDGTDDIMRSAAQAQPFVHLVTRTEVKGGRSFASKAFAFRAGYEALNGIDYDFIGNLDADVSFASGYYEAMLAEMVANPRLGVASGVIVEHTATGVKQLTLTRNHASGAVQFWRRECFEEIGGYRPASVGGVDSLAVLTARMQGWESRTFPPLVVVHHKPVDSASGGRGVRIAYRAGMTEYHIGTYFPFAVLKAVRRWKQTPMFLSSAARIFGFLKLWLLGVRRDAPPELVTYLRKEQIKRLQCAILRRQE